MVCILFRYLHVIASVFFFVSIFTSCGSVTQMIIPSEPTIPEPTQPVIPLPSPITPPTDIVHVTQATDLTYHCFGDLADGATDALGSVPIAIQMNCPSTQSLVAVAFTSRNCGQIAVCALISISDTLVNEGNRIINTAPFIARTSATCAASFGASVPNSFTFFCH